MFKISEIRLLKNLNNGHERSIKAKKNIFFTIIIRICSVAISFLLVPLTIHYVKADSYGIWLTLSSIVGWASFFNFGINNGLRNKLTECLAVRDFSLAQKYVSTTYAILTLIFIPLFIIFVSVGYYFDWSKILNSPSNMAAELYSVALIVFGYFCIQFVLSTVNIVLLSSQMPAGESIRSLIEQGFALIVIYILTKTTNGSLVKLSIGLCITPLIILLYFNIVLFRGRFKSIRPIFAKIDLSVSKSLFGIGFRFFVIQIAGIVQFQTANFLIITYFRPYDVAVYNISYKYFSGIIMVMGIFMTPLWSAVTDAYVKKDLQWIESTVKKYQMLSLLLICLGGVMLAFSSFFYALWLGKTEIVIPFNMSFWMFILSAVSVFGSVYCGVLNGISAIKIQFYASLVSPLIFLLLAYLFIVELKLGVVSIVIASILSNFNAIVIAPLQYYKVFGQHRRDSIWNQ